MAAGKGPGLTQGRRGNQHLIGLWAWQEGLLRPHHTCYSLALSFNWLQP